jgi:hypothetical protein
MGRIDADQPTAPVVRDPDLAERERDPVRLPADANRLDDLVLARADPADGPGDLVRDPKGAGAVRERVRVDPDTRILACRRFVRAFRRVTFEP